MKPTIQLINALRKAADRIETKPDDYDWTTGAECNCGILAQELLCMTPRQVFFATKNEPYFTGCWSSLCKATGQREDSIVRALAEAGVIGDDLRDIEYLASGKVLDRIAPLYRSKRRPQEPYTEAANVIRYFRAQADILVEQLGEQFESRPLLLTQPPLTQPGPGGEVNAI